MINVSTVSNNLRSLSQLIINGKSPRNMEAIRYSTQMMPAVKEPVTFTLNTE